MINRLQKKYALSVQGAKDLFKAIVYSVLANISLILLLNLMCWRWHFRHSMNCLCFLMALRLKESWFRPYRMKHG